MPLDEAYFVWLYSQVGSVQNRNRSKTYWTLLRLLHEKKFTWTKKFDKDGNRAQDGKNLRREFLRTTGTALNKIDDGWMDLDCSMLELFVALSWKLAFEGEGEPHEWFWVLIDNIGLTECNDANPPEKVIIDEILDKVIYREYARNGAGGLFPLQRTKEDQRGVELWYQMQAYLLERF
jgi:hypothetical protein